MYQYSRRGKIVTAIALVALVALVPMSGEAQTTLYVEGDRVSIGKDTPQAPLEIDADGSTAGTGNSVVLLKKTGGLAFQLDDTSVSGFWNFSVAGGETEFRVSRSGTGQTEMKLSESGDLTITGDVFTTTCSPCVSDYVFEPGYDLMPLDELGSYIEENGHLPNIPSEAEYQERGGVALHEMQVKLLEKIEELTLYTLQQQKLIDQLLAEREAQGQGDSR